MFTKIAQSVEAILSLTLLVILTIMIVSITAQVVGRYVFDYSPSWTEEIARMSIAWITMLGSAVVMRSGGHIAVTVVVNALPWRIARFVIFIRQCLILVMAGSLAWYGYGYAVIGGRRASPALEIPMYYPFLAIPIGSVMIGLLLVLHMGSRPTKEGATS